MRAGAAPSGGLDFTRRAGRCQRDFGIPSRGVFIPRGAAITDATAEIARPANDTRPDSPGRAVVPRAGFAVLVALALALLAFAAFAPALDYAFVNFDDDVYVTKNPLVTAGLSADGARRALTTFHAANWHPLTWLSLQLDAAFARGPDGKLVPRGFHRTNVLLHAANAALAFLALRALTGAFWRSAAAALLFAVHPLRVESVAWVAERKDVLSVCFGLLTLWAYAGYARRPSLGRYVAVATLFALSLMAKPTLVTLPCLLLVLDWWPLRRAVLTPSPLVGEGRGEGCGRQKPPPTLTLPHKGGGDKAPLVRTCLIEKLPLFALATASCVLTLRAQAAEGAVVGLEGYAPDVRVANAAVSYAVYLWHSVWPVGLAPYYPHPGNGLSVGQVAGGLALLAALSAGAVLLRRRAPYLLAGWLWYLGTLVPVLGLVQVGDQAMADRYTYFPQIGLLVAVCWGVAELARGRAGRWAVVSGVAAAAVLLAARTRAQLPIWRDSLTLWEYEARVTPPSHNGLLNLGCAYREQGRPDEAVRCFRETLRLAPKSFLAHSNLAGLLFERGDDEEGIWHLEEACRIAPGAALPRLNLGGYFIHKGNPAAAVRWYEDALRLQPDSAEICARLGDALQRAGRRDEGVARLREAVRLDPEYAQGHATLGLALADGGDLEGAARHLEIATRLRPGLAANWYNLGIARGRQGLLEEKAECLRRAVERDPSSARYRKALEEALDALTAAGHADAARRIGGRVPRGTPVPETGRSGGTP